MSVLSDSSLDGSALCGSLCRFVGFLNALIVIMIPLLFPPLLLFIYSTLPHLLPPYLSSSSSTLSPSHPLLLPLFILSGTHVSSPVSWPRRLTGGAREGDSAWTISRSWWWMSTRPALFQWAVRMAVMAFTASKERTNVLCAKATGTQLRPLQVPSTSS